MKFYSLVIFLVSAPVQFSQAQELPLCIDSTFRSVGEFQKKDCTSQKVCAYKILCGIGKWGLKSAQSEKDFNTDTAHLRVRTLAMDSKVSCPKTLVEFNQFFNLKSNVEKKIEENPYMNEHARGDGARFDQDGVKIKGVEHYITFGLPEKDRFSFGLQRNDTVAVSLAMLHGKEAACKANICVGRAFLLPPVKDKDGKVIEEAMYRGDEQKKNASWMSASVFVACQSAQVDGVEPHCGTADRCFNDSTVVRIQSEASGRSDLPANVIKNTGGAGVGL